MLEAGNECLANNVFAIGNSNVWSRLGRAPLVGRHGMESLASLAGTALIWTSLWWTLRWLPSDPPIALGAPFLVFGVLLVTAQLAIEDRT